VLARDIRPGKKDALKRDTPARSLAAFPLWLALVGAGVEVAVIFLQKRWQPLLRVSEDFVWMAPLALLAVAATTVALFTLVGRAWRPDLARVLALFVTSSMVFLNLLMLVPRLAHYAAAILAAGCGVQATRVVLRRQDAAARLARRSTPWIVGAFALCGSGMWVSLRPEAGHAAGATATSGQPPNVVLITLDTVRAANLSLYGYTRNTTPEIDRFAEGGVVFEQAFTSSPWTLPSHASMFTGRWPHELSADYTSPLDSTYPTLAEYLGTKGYTTAGFVANLGYCSHETGLGRGFHYYEDYPRSVGQIVSSSTILRTVADNFRLRTLLQNDEHLNRVTAEAINARALNWLSTRTGGPFFMFLNYFDAHEPYLPPPPFDRQFGSGRQRGRYSPLRRWLWDPGMAHRPLLDAERREEMDAYDGALAYLDHHLGRLFEELERRKILGNTIVIITSDHGEEFGEHGVYEHGYSLYRAGVHVPLIVVAPNLNPVTRRVATPVSLRSLATTVVDLVGLGAGAPFPGHPLANLWRHPSDQPAAYHDLTEPLLSQVSRTPGHPEWFPTSKGDMKAVAAEGMRYIRNGDGTEELYDFDHDAAEQHNLAQAPEHRAALVKARQLLDRLMAPISGK
jgi:arylsulfatase A-like enzyme